MPMKVMNNSTPTAIHNTYHQNERICHVWWLCTKVPAVSPRFR